MRLFLYGLYLAVAFRLIQTTHQILVGSPLPIILLGVFNLLLILYFLHIYPEKFTLSVIIFYGMALCSSLFFWNDTGGWDGSRPYTLIVLVVAIVITSHGVLQVALLAAYGLVMLMLSTVTLPEWTGSRNDNYSVLSLEFDFLVNTLTLILIVWHLKMRFFSYRESVEVANEELSNASETLDAQTRQLHEQQVELNAIRNNLEDIVSVKTREVLEKSDVLKTYAFVNAHHVRGPLARILGLIHLIELEEGSHPQSGTLDKIKQEAEKMDAIIQRINEITS